MHIEELKEVEGELEIGAEKELIADVQHKEIVVSNSKRFFILIGARALFYPTLLYNVIRNKIQSEFRWWDGIDQFILLGAVPFPTDVPRLKQLGVHGVITLNEPYETLVPTSLYHAYGIDHLVIPTRDYLFAPSYGDICRAVNFIHKNASSRKTTYVHCKAGRGRSTTIVLCYLVQYRQMSPDAAFKYVKSIRSRVLLASSQWKAVNEFYYRLHVNRTDNHSNLKNHLISKISGPIASIPELAIFDESSVVVVTESDLDGYDGNSRECGIMRNDVWAAVSLIYRVQFASQTALARLSCLRLGCLARQNLLVEKLSRESSSSSVDEDDQLGGHGVDIHVYC